MKACFPVSISVLVYVFPYLIIDKYSYRNFLWKPQTDMSAVHVQLLDVLSKHIKLYDVVLMFG